MCGAVRTGDGGRVCSTNKSSSSCVDIISGQSIQGKCHPITTRIINVIRLVVVVVVVLVVVVVVVVVIIRRKGGGGRGGGGKHWFLLLR